MPLLDIANAEVLFGRGTPTEVAALRGVSLQLEPGDYLSVVGSNGAGKSTLLNVISGAVELSTGRVTFDGQDITTEPDYKRAGDVARVFQNPLAGTCPSLSIEENLVLAETRGLRRGLRLGVTTDRRRAFRTVLAPLGLGLEDRMSELVEALSGGQRQSLTVMMATLRTPQLLLLDEHTAALDPRMQRQVMGLTDELIRSGSLTTVMVTHNLQQALTYGNRLIMMHRGRILLQLDADEKAGMSVQNLLELFEGTDFMVTDTVVLDDARKRGESNELDPPEAGPGDPS